MAETIGKNTARFDSGELYLALTGERVRMSPGWNWQFEGVATDSRLVENGNVFVALKGEKFDGHKFIPQVARIPKIFIVHSDKNSVRGIQELPTAYVPDTLVALGALARYHRQRFDIPLIGITGSYGKTSTRALLFVVLCSKFNTLTSQANFNNEIGVPMTLFQLDETHEAAVIEMGMRGRDQIDYLAKVAEPTIGVITNIGPQHIELLGSIEEVALAKAELLENLPENGLAVLPFDSPFLELLKSKCKCRIVTFGVHDGADYRVGNAQISPEGWVEFSIEFGENSQPITLRLPGIHNAVNASAAFAVAHQLGIEPSAIALALEGAELPGARMRVVKPRNGVTLIDDCYNAGPDSMRAALQTLLDFPGSGRRVAVLGSMKELGDFSEPEHQKIGTFAGQFVELLIGVGGETRPLLNEASRAAREVENDMEVHWYDTAQEAQQEIVNLVHATDVILVKGSRSVGLEVVVEVLGAE
ncbi:UDP-N-acetylmuramoyl-tripeptide--D-alanyl-D-alanine ligase [Abditibacteriota bacterium]|nr:UDP-N-acetylmuramoyl-tripeptide--D-alanyl-D-alanine ligase [Abditibacteriota bacterium]